MCVYTKILIYTLGTLVHRELKRYGNCSQYGNEIIEFEPNTTHPSLDIDAL